MQRQGKGDKQIFFEEPGRNGCLRKVRVRQQANRRVHTGMYKPGPAWTSLRSIASKARGRQTADAETRRKALVLRIRVREFNKWVESNEIDSPIDSGGGGSKK